MIFLTGYKCSQLMVYLTGFILCAFVIFFAGRKLIFYADMIAAITGIGNAWIGLVLMAFITSLPELMVGISSSAIIQSADLAVGDVLGSCAFNLGILALMDAFVPKHKPLLGLASQNHIIAAAMGISLIALAGTGLFLPEEFVIIGGIGITSIFFIIIYFFSVWLLYRFDTTHKQATAEGEHNGQQILSLPKTIGYFSVYALIIISAALLLPYFIDNIAAIAGLNKTFAGTLLLAGSTSLPEIAVSIAAVRRGSIDMAVGNLLGSNMFNIFILAIDDIFYTKGHLLKDASDLHLVSCMATIIMAAVAIIGLSYRLQAKKYWLAWDALLIFGVYILNILLLYHITT